MYTEFPIASFVAAALVLVPLPWHWRARNVATLSMIVWLFIVNIIYGIDSVLWGNSTAIKVPVWCDITTRVLIGSTMALSAACMCVCIHLERVASIRQVRTSASDKRKRQLFEGVMCFLVPILWMALHYIVQGHRFDIIEEYGCRPSTYVSLPAILLIWFPPLFISAVTGIFAVLAIVHFIRRRIVFAKHLESSNSGLNTSRYFRLIMMAISEMFISIAGTTATMVFSIKFDYRPWTNWDDVHWNFSRIDRYPKTFTPRPFADFYYGLWWIVPLSSVTFFLFFGFGQEAMKEYSSCMEWIKKYVFRRTPAMTTKTTVPFVIRTPLRPATSSTPSLPTTSTSSFPQPLTPSLALKKAGERYSYESYSKDEFLPTPMYSESAHDSHSSYNGSSYYSSMSSLSMTEAGSLPFSRTSLYRTGGDRNV